MEFTFNTGPSEPDISSFDKSVDPAQLASQKPADYGHNVFIFSCTCMFITRVGSHMVFVWIHCMEKCLTSFPQRCFK